MKFLMIAVITALCGCGFASQDAKVSIEVVDEKGIRLDGCTVSAVFEVNGKEVTTTGVSNTNTFFTATETPTQPYVTVIATKDGYYKSSKTYMFKSGNASKMRMEPWNPTITLVLRKIIDPVSGKGVDRCRGCDRDFPVYDKAIGFDLLKGDWVAPHGLGEQTDFMFTISRDKENKIAYYKAEFVNKGDGIQEYFFVKPIRESRFRWPHTAPIDGYRSLLKKKYVWGGDQTRLPDFEEFPEYDSNRKKPLNYIFRIRTQYDDEGVIKSAYYGRITGDIINMRYNNREMLNYWINTNPTSRSLESTDLVESDNRVN